MILVTAAFGNVGRRVIPRLVEKGHAVKAFDINPAVEEMKRVGVAACEVGDARDVEAVRRALKGCDQVLYIPPMFSYQEAKIANLVVDMATVAGVRQFVMLSVTHPLMSTLLQHTQKLKAEEHLVYKGLSHGLNYTILQPMHYNHNLNVRQVVETGEYSIFYSVGTKLSYVDCEDVGEVAAKILAESTHANATYELVGPDFLSPNDLVAIVNQEAGVNAKARHILIEELIRTLGITDSYAIETFIQLADTYSRYGIAGNQNVCQWLLGRRPTSFAEYVRRELERMRNSAL